MGTPNDQWKDDVEGKPEGAALKAVRGAAKFTAKITKSVAKDSGLVDDKWAEVATRAADVVEQQANADPHASIKDRAKLAGTNMCPCTGFIHQHD